MYYFNLALGLTKLTSVYAISLRYTCKGIGQWFDIVKRFTYMHKSYLTTQYSSCKEKLLPHLLQCSLYVAT